MSNRQRVILGIYAIAATLNVIASGIGSHPLDHVTKPVLMPLLALVVWAAVPTPPSRRLIIAGLLFATGGDIALMDSATVTFLIGMALFLGCHICYITAFARGGAFVRLRSRPTAAIAYGIVLVIALIFLWGPLGGMAAPIAVYAIALATMASAASTFGLRVGIGGALFLLSDMLIALGIANVNLPGFLVMITYVIGQAMIATGWLMRPTVSVEATPPHATTSAGSRR
jgi:uncharacterized membrane protein YhhN